MVLGKFAPLHKGHQLLIETAIKQTNKVIVLIYDSPQVTNIPLDIRANWIRKLYPQVKVIEGQGAPADSGRTRRIMRLQENYVRDTVNEKITDFFSSEWYGAHMSKALGARNVIVDKARKIIPISGTKVRKDSYKYKNYVDPVVYKDLVTKVVFLGAESTGKSTITERLAIEYKTAWMSEYGREYWYENQKDGILTKEQLVELAKGHLARENEALLKANKYLFVDTNAITTYMFSLYYHNSAYSKLIYLAKKAEERYDYYFVCDTDIPYEDDGSRSGQEQRIKFQKEILADLEKRNIKYHLLKGDLKTRMETVARIIGGPK